MEERRSFVRRRWRSHDSKRPLDLGARNGKPSSASPAYAKIVVIGHGETEWNADGRIQLQIFTALDE
ncbi:hypothetical protein LguiA_017516 [Lonicera macranthoides]